MNYLTPQDVKVLFLGTPDIAVTVLEALIEDGFDVVGVVTQEDKPVGRKHVLTPSPVKTAAMNHEIPVFTPHKIKEDYEFAKNLGMDVIICIAYGQIVPMEFIDLAKKKALNLHVSLLPELRGASPIQSALLEGKTLTGVSLMAMEKGMDTGAVYAQEELKIEEKDNSTSLFLKAGELSASMISKYLLLYMNDELEGIKQDDSKATYCKKFGPEDEKICLLWPKKRILNLIRALSYAPGAYLNMGDKKLKILEAHEVEGKGKTVGKLLYGNKKLILSCVDGLISLDKIQLEGKKMMDAPSFLNGARLEGEIILS